MDVEKINPYGAPGAKGQRVGEMFDAIAPKYDLMNTAMTFGLHKHWRNKALRMLALAPGCRVLDVATGTGDVAFKLYETYHPYSVTGIDLSEGMLAIARRKLAEMPADARKRIGFGIGDSLCLPFPDDSYDAVTVAYGVRNFEHLDRGLKEMARVLTPGGRLCIIELSEPRKGVARTLYRLYARRIIPMVGRMVSGDGGAYTYLPESIAAAPQREGLVAMMMRAGLTDCSWHSLTFGSVCIYFGTKPEA